MDHRETSMHRELRGDKGVNLYIKVSNLLDFVRQPVFECYPCGDKQ